MSNESTPEVGNVIDVNSDVGESFGHWRLGDDVAMLALVTSANVACGFHAGDPTTLRSTCAEATARGVAIGAQVGYRDLAGFGRRFVDVPPAELVDDVLYQLGALETMARVGGAGVRYVKPHGALYNAVVHHEAQAQAVVDAVVAFDASLPVLGLPGSALLARAERAGLRTVGEAFADRAYRADGTLVPRSEPGAVLSDPAAAAQQALRLVRAGGVGSVCVHGDSPDSVELATAVRAVLDAAGVTVERFT